MTTELPADYIAYVEGDGVSESATEGDPGYFQLWPPEEIEEMNRKIGVPTMAPGFLGFGSDGGGELLAFDKTGAVFMLPMVGMEAKYAKKIADSWARIQERISE
jgi:hypothetical protein